MPRRKCTNDKRCKGERCKRYKNLLVRPVRPFRYGKNYNNTLLGLPKLRSKMESINDKIWLHLMAWGAEKWGCHQLPERSFFIGKYQFPVCARCTGIIAGELFALISIFGAKKAYPKLWICLIPLIIDGVTQYFASYISNNKKRLITGFMFGIGFVNLLLSAAIYLYKLQKNR